MKELGIDESWIQLDIKNKNIAIEEIEYMCKLSGGYEALFSRKAIKFRERNLHLKELSENEYKNLILEEYTFLKRPVIIYNDKIYIGNNKKLIEALKSIIFAK